MKIVKSNGSLLIAGADSVNDDPEDATPLLAISEAVLK